MGLQNCILFCLQMSKIVAKNKKQKNRFKTLYNSLQNTLQFVKNLAIAFAKSSKIAYNFWINFIENKRKFAIMRYNIKNRFISIMWKHYRVRWEYAKYCIKNLFKKSSEKIPKLSPRCIISYIRITSCLGMQLYQQLFFKKEACIHTQRQTKNYLYNYRFIMWSVWNFWKQTFHFSCIFLLVFP